MIDPSFLDQLKELELTTRKRVSSSYSGGRASIKQGRGIEVVDYREYIPGDDFRLIDWRLYGRTEKLYIRRFEEEKDLSMHILLDTSSSMDFTTHKMTKFDYGGSLAIGFGYLSVHNMEKFAVGLYSKELREQTQARKSQVHLFNVIDLLNRTTLKDSTDLGVAASQYSKLMKTKAFTVVISDFMEEIDSITEGIYRLARHSAEMLLVQVMDPWEVDLGWEGDINFQDMESADMKRTYLSPNFKKEYVTRVNQHNSQISQICSDIGIKFKTVLTNTALIESFVNVVGGGRRSG